MPDYRRTAEAAWAARGGHQRLPLVADACLTAVDRRGASRARGVTTSAPSASEPFTISVCVPSLAPVVTATGAIVVPLDTHTVADLPAGAFAPGRRMREHVRVGLEAQRRRRHAQDVVAPRHLDRHRSPSCPASASTPGSARR